MLIFMADSDDFVFCLNPQTARWQCSVYSFLIFYSDFMHMVVCSLCCNSFCTIRYKNRLISPCLQYYNTWQYIEYPGVMIRIILPVSCQYTALVFVLCLCIWKAVVSYTFFIVHYDGVCYLCTFELFVNRHPMKQSAYCYYQRLCAVHCISVVPIITLNYTPQVMLLM